MSRRGCTLNRPNRNDRPHVRPLAALLAAVLLTLAGLPAAGAGENAANRPCRPGIPGGTPAPSALPTIGVGEVRTGQKGYGLSVFSGGQPERFEVEVVGVHAQHIRPEPSYILARLTGKGLEKQRRHRRHERQPGLPRRPAGRRGGVRLAVLPRGDRRDHADRPTCAQLSGLPGSIRRRRRRRRPSSSPASSPAPAGRTCWRRRCRPSDRRFRQGAQAACSGSSSGFGERSLGPAAAVAGQRRAVGPGRPGRRPDWRPAARWPRCWSTATSSWPPWAPSPTA